MVRQYQVVLDPDRMRALGIAQATVVEALRKANQAAGGSVVELAEAEYMVRSRGYLRSLDDFRSIPLAVSGATPVLLRDVATVQIGPELRRGIAELDGEGEVAGGVVVMRSGKNARSTIEAVKAKLETLKPSLPAGVEIVPTYDRSLLIDRADRQPALEARRGIHRRRARLRDLPVPSALGARRGGRPADRRARRVRRHALARGQRQHHVARRHRHRDRRDGRRGDRDGRERHKHLEAFEARARAAADVGRAVARS